MEYIIVNSVKGGCGKSSISLRTAIDLSLVKEEKEVKNEGTGETEIKTIYPNNVLVIDMDILGSSLRTFVTGELYKQELNKENTDIDWKDTNGGYWLLQDTHDPQETRSKGDPICFSDIFYKKYEDFNTKPIETPFKVCTANNEQSNIHIAFSSENQTVKNRFRAQKSNNYTPIVNVRYYEAVLRKYIKFLKTSKTFSNQKLTHIIFDMPPNSDPYSDCVFSLLLNKIKDDIQNEVEKDKRDTVELRVVSSCDLAHIGANLLWMENLFDKNGLQYARPNKISFLVNDITGAANLGEKKGVRDAVLKKVEEALNWSVFDKIEKKTLWYNRDEVLILSSACKACVAFSNMSIEDCGKKSETEVRAESNDGENSAVQPGGEASQDPSHSEQGESKTNQKISADSQRIGNDY